jgi:hypothetical protein
MDFPHLPNAYQNRLIGQTDSLIEYFSPATSSASSLSSPFLHFSTSEERRAGRLLSNAKGGERKKKKLK